MEPRRKGVVLAFTKMNAAHLKTLNFISILHSLGYEEEISVASLEWIFCLPDTDVEHFLTNLMQHLDIDNGHACALDRNNVDDYDQFVSLPQTQHIQAGDDSYYSCVFG